MGYMYGRRQGHNMRNGVEQLKGESEMLRKWFNRFNKEYFDGQLHVQIIGWYREVSFRTGGQAVLDHYDGVRIQSIGINPIFNEMKVSYKNTLIHEMIHIWQFQEGKIDLDNQGHGYWFNYKADEIMRKNPEFSITRYTDMLTTDTINAYKKFKVKTSYGYY